MKNKFAIKNNNIVERYKDSFEHACGGKFQYNHVYKAYQFYSSLSLQTILSRILHITNRSFNIEREFCFFDKCYRDMFIITLVKKRRRIMMESNKIQPITNKKVCMKCLKEKVSVKHYHLYERGFGSDFDGLSSMIQICNECKPESLEKWLNEKPSFPFGDNITEDYQYEDKIQDFIDKLPLEGQELFWNHYAKGFSANTKDRVDFLAIESATASDEIYKKYNMFTPNEMKMSKERYPTCANVIDVKYSDNSRGNRCILHNILGNINSKSNYYNTKCNTCKDYKKLKEGEERFIITMQNLETKEECLKRK